MSTGGLCTHLHITIGAAPLLEGDIPAGKSLSVHRLEHELLLVKAALLYGDRATLYSPFSSLVLRMLRFSDEPLKDRLRYLEAGAARSAVDDDPVAITQEEVEKYRSILRKSYPNNKQLKFKAGFELKMRQLQEAARDLADKAMADGIVGAMDAGLLVVHRFGPSLNAAMDDTDTAAEEFLEMMKSVVADATTYPLFDADLGNWIGAGIRDGSIAVSETGAIRGKQVGLAAALLERLPLFDMATIQEIVDIRRELERPLVRFRAALIGYAGGVEHEQWDDDFAFDADQVFQRDVAPAVEEIAEAIKANSRLSALARRAVDKPLTVPSGSALAIALSSLSSLPHALTQAVGLIGASGLVVYDGFKAWQEKQRDIEKNQLYFYYAVGKRLQELP